MVKLHLTFFEIIKVINKITYFSFQFDLITQKTPPGFVIGGTLVHMVQTCRSIIELGRLEKSQRAYNNREFKRGHSQFITPTL